MTTTAETLFEDFNMEAEVSIMEAIFFLTECIHNAGFRQVTHARDGWFNVAIVDPEH